MDAFAGSLSHSHLNCVFRNIVDGRSGCECADPVVTGCKCKASPILNKDGKYDLEKLKKRDEACGTKCSVGLPFEMLRWEMDVEEPGAASIISIALNKKNEVAMKTSHTEIMNCLAGLCNPTPDTMEVKWEPVRDRMIELYGTAVDHPDFFQAFRLMLDLGGSGSPHVEDLREFINFCVNAKVRKMRFEAYPVVTGYPKEAPKLKTSSIKWAWKQQTTRGWCQLPPSIAHRFDQSSTYEMHDFIVEIDETMRWATRCARELIGWRLWSDQETRVGADALKAWTKWIAEVDIGIMKKYLEERKNQFEKVTQNLI